MVLLQPLRPPPARPAGWPVIVRQSLPAGHGLRGGVLVLGTFDGFHLGHRALVAMACRIARGRPVAVMSCEPHPRAFFGAPGGPFRLATPGAKQRLLAGEGVDFVFSPRFDAAFAGLSPEEFAGEVLAGGLGVSAVVAGEDFRFGRGRAGDMAMLAALGRRHGFGVHAAPEVAAGGGRISSTRIRAAIRAGDLAGAGRLLGAPWLVEVLRGTDGRLHLHPGLCRPAAGDYLATPEGHEDRGPVRTEITAEGLFLPAMPLDATPPAGGASAFWRLGAA